MTCGENAARTITIRAATVTPRLRDKIERWKYFLNRQKDRVASLSYGSVAYIIFT